jgi:predicted dehydrogenase
LADKEISAVIIALPISTQPAVILKSLAAGKHILSEKPIASTLEEGLSLIKTYNETYKSKGIHWRVAENFECEPIFHAARAAIEKGKIGEVRHFDLRNIADVQLDNKWYKTPWRTIPDVSPFFKSSSLSIKCS